MNPITRLGWISALHATTAARLAFGAACLLLSSGALMGCGAPLIIGPRGVVIVEPTEEASERLHDTCDYQGVYDAAGDLSAMRRAASMGANVVLPLGRADASYRDTSTYTAGDFRIRTTVYGAYGSLAFAMFQCDRVPTNAGPR